MQIIHAWIRNPDHAIFKGESKRAALFQLLCEDSAKCELYTKYNSCLLQGAFTGCKYGRKVEREGPTKRARKYYDWMSEAKESNKDFIGTLSTGTSYSGIFKVQDYWYMPYSLMIGSKSNRHPLESAWVHADDMTPELLEGVCTAQPRSSWGYSVIEKYQNEIVPRFLHDLAAKYPELFDLLPDKQKLRAENISYIGRKADIRTCAAGTYKMGTEQWEWDGEKLIGSSMLFQPAKGKIRIEIEPEAGQSVEITNDSQVTTDTVFLD